ncbi:MAG: ADOP family duplicated permease [Myxococcales bacterium]
MTAFRALRRRPGFAIGAVALLGVSLGASGALFAAIDATLLQPLPFRDPGRLVWIWSTRTDRDRAFFSLPDAVTYRARLRTLAFVPFAPWNAALTGAGDPERVQGARVTANSLEVLGAVAEAGRLLQSADDEPSAPPVVVISDAFWHRQFAGDPKAVGSAIVLDGRGRTIVGVLGARFPGLDADVIAPLSPATHPRLNDYGTNFLQAFGRLRGSLDDARAEMAAINADLVHEHPDDNAKKTPPRILPLQDELTSAQRAPLWVLLGAVALLLLIACFNVGNLLLARTAQRAHELAVRSALGATGPQLAWSILAEALLVAGAAWAVSLVLVAWGADLLLALAPAGVSIRSGVSPRTLAFVLACAGLAALGCGLPALAIVRRVRPAGAMSGDRISAGRAAGRLRALAVMIEVALSLVLLVGAGLLLRSFAHLLAVDPGFSAEGAASVRLSLPPDRYATGDAIERFAEAVTAQLPNAGLVNVLPLSGLNVRSDFTVAGRPPLKQSEVPAAQTRYATAGYFAAMGIPLKSGRIFSALDRAPVLVVDESLARRHFPGEDPVGKHLIVDGHDFEIVGVAGPILHDGLEQPASPTIYVPIRQITQPTSFLAARLFLVARGVTPDVLRRAVHALDREVPVSDGGALARQVASALAARRFLLRLLLGFGAAALLLTAFGVFAVISASVVLRTREIGIRRALGAQAAQVSRLIVGQSLRLCGAGALLGLLASAFANRLLRGLLYGVGAADPAAWSMACAALLFVALVAAWRPARAAASVDPLVALRD